MDVVEDDLKYIYFDKKKEKRVSSLQDLVALDEGTLYYKRTNEKMYACEAHRVNGKLQKRSSEKGLAVKFHEPSALPMS